MVHGMVGMGKSFEENDGMSIFQLFPSPNGHPDSCPMIIEWLPIVTHFQQRLLRWSSSCRKTSDTLGFIYFAMVIVLLIMFREKVKGVAKHFGSLVPVLFGKPRR